LQGRPVHLDAHLARLEAGANALGSTAPWLSDCAGPILAWLAAVLPGQDGALRLTLETDSARLMARLEDLPSTPAPYGLVPLPHPLIPRRSDPRIRHKGLGGAWGAAVLAKAEASGGADALLLWADGTLAETAIAAVGVESGQRFHLPESLGRVASLTEKLDLPLWAQDRGLTITTGPISLVQARRGQVWCLNALRGIWPATLL
jgi:branched-subunit amino acid aminotransferase/4-amino-4-deoxychorismate lyase